MATANPRRTTKPRTSRTAGRPVLSNVITLSTEDERDQFTERQPLFELDGVVYEARTEFSASETWQYARKVRTEGLDAGVEFAMELALGKEGADAFFNYPYLTREKAGLILDQVVNRISGPTKVLDPKGKMS